MGKQPAEMIHTRGRVGVQMGIHPADDLTGASDLYEIEMGSADWADRICHRRDSRPFVVQPTRDGTHRRSGRTAHGRASETGSYQVTFRPAGACSSSAGDRSGKSQPVPG